MYKKALDIDSAVDLSRLPAHLAVRLQQIRRHNPLESQTGKNLELIFSLQHERTVNQDNTVHLGWRILQIEKTRWRATLAGCRVTIYEHLDGSCSIGYGPHIIGGYHRTV